MDQLINANLKAFDYVMSASGLGNFSNTELEKALAGKQASASVALGLTRQYVNGQTTPTDIETMMQLVYLNFTNIKKDEKFIQFTDVYIESAAQEQRLDA
jgi:zinc protease